MKNFSVKSPRPLTHLLLSFVVFALASGCAAPRVQADGPSRVYLPVVMAGPRTQYAWHTFFGAGNADYGTDVVSDGTGNLYVAGYSYDNWNGPNGEGPVSPHPAPRARPAAVVLALDAQGNYRWHTFAGEGFWAALALAPDGSIYVTATLAPDWRGPAGQSPLHPFSGGDSDLSVVKLDSAGHYLWHTFYGSAAADVSQTVAVDSAGNVVLGGFSTGNWTGPGGTAPLHPFRDTLYAPSGGDAVIVKLSAAGAYRWHTFYGASGVGCIDEARSLATGADDTVYATGGACHDWSTDDGVPPLRAGQLADIFALKLNASGQHQWHTFWGSEAYQSGTDLGLDQAGNLHIAFMSGDSWSGENGSSPLHQSDGANSNGALKLAATGQYVWHTFYGGQQFQTTAGIAVTEEGTSFLTWSAQNSFLGDGDRAPRRPFPGNADSTAIVALGPSGAYRWHAFYGSPAGQTNYANDPRPEFRAGNLYVVGTEFPWLGEGGALPKHGHSGAIDLYVLGMKAE